MDKAITTAFMIIVSVIVSVMVFNAVYPGVVQGADTLAIMQARMEERMKSQIAIIHTTGEMDSTGTWQDTNGDGHFNTFIWVKNIGVTRITAIADMDLFLGPEGNFTRIPYKDDAGGSYPYWDLAIENDSQWNPTATARITVYYSGTPPRGRYFVKVVVPNGPNAATFFSL